MSHTLRVEPAVGLLDDHNEVVVEGARPGATVVVTSRTRDEAGRAWAARAEFQADADGRVVVSKAASTGGTYQGVDAMGLFWSMVPEDDEPRSPFEKETAEPVVVAIEAEADGSTVGCEVRRLLAGPGVERIDLDLPGVVGYAFRPAGEGPFPGVLVLGGSGGALLQCSAALLASRGLAAVAVSYFGREGLPAEIADIPLEPMIGVLGWLRAQPWVGGSGLGVVGTSKGGEAAFLLGVHVPDVRAVAMVNGSGVHYQALTGRGAFGPTWTLGGEAIDYLPVTFDLAAAAKATYEQPLESATAFRAALDDAEAVEKASIPVERINGPMLLVVGDDDQVWPSVELADLVVERLARHGRPDDATVVCYPDAGHDLTVPNLPTTGIVSVRRGLFRALGGTPPGKAHAERDSWRRLVEFLRAALQ